MYLHDNNDAIPRRGQGVQPLHDLDRPEDWFNALPPLIRLPAYRTMVTNGTIPKPGDPSVYVCPTAQATTNDYFLSVRDELLPLPDAATDAASAVRNPAPSFDGIHGRRRMRLFINRSLGQILLGAATPYPTRERDFPGRACAILCRRLSRLRFGCRRSRPMCVGKLSRTESITRPFRELIWRRESVAQQLLELFPRTFHRAQACVFHLLIKLQCHPAGVRQLCAPAALSAAHR